MSKNVKLRNNLNSCVFSIKLTSLVVKEKE